MDCEGVRSRITEYVEGDLNVAEAGALEEHVRNCAGCSSEVRLAGRINDTLRSEPLIDPPAALVEGVLQRAVADAPLIQRSPRLAWITPVSVGVVAAACLLLGVCIEADVFTDSFYQTTGSFLDMVQNHIWLITTIVVVYVLFGDLLPHLKPATARTKGEERPGKGKQ